MKVDYINTEITDDVVRVTFVGYDPSTNKRRRPMIELDSNDLCTLISAARSYRRRQQQLAEKHAARANVITQLLQENPA